MDERHAPAGESRTVPKTSWKSYANRPPWPTNAREFSAVEAKAKELNGIDQLAHISARGCITKVIRAGDVPHGSATICSAGIWHITDVFDLTKSHGRAGTGHRERDVTRRLLPMHLVSAKGRACLSEILFAARRSSFGDRQAKLISS